MLAWFFVPSPVLQDGYINGMLLKMVSDTCHLAQNFTKNIQILKSFISSKDNLLYQHNISIRYSKWWDPCCLVFAIFEYQIILE